MTSVNFSVTTTRNMESLQRSRRGHKAHITVLRNKVSDVLEKNDMVEIQTLQDSLIKQIEKVESLNEQISFVITEEDALVKEITEAGEYSFEVRVEIQKLISAVNKSLPPTPCVTNKSMGVKLPKLNIRKFDGDFTQWLSFWDIYDASVHKRTDMEGVEKFTYLKGLLEGDALKLIEGFNLESRYYDEAVKLLQNTYGQRSEIKMSFVKKLLNLESPDANPESLQEFRSNFECQIRSLKSLNLTLDEFYTILLYCKLPASISEIIKRKAEDEWLTLDTFKKQLESEINNLRTFNGNISQSPVYDRPMQPVNPISTLIVKNDVPSGGFTRDSNLGPPMCSLCKASHSWNKCVKYYTREAKLARIKELGLCFVCGQRGHLSTYCKKASCGKGCTFKHHIVLCPNKKGTGKVKGNGRLSNNGERKLYNKGDKEGVQVATLSVGTSKTQPVGTTQKSVLPTATVILKGKDKHMVKARGLLDPCAERTFVCRSLLNCLKYKQKGTVKLRLLGYCSSVPERTYDVVTLFIPYRGNLINVEAVVVDELPQYNRDFSVAATLRELRGVKLADQEFELPKEKQSPIKLLVGVDNVYSILHPGFKRMGKLILLPSIFGYVLTGSYKDRTSNNETNVVSILKLATTPVDDYLEYPSVVENERTHKTEMESLWSMDHLGICDTEINNQDKEVLKNFENTVTYSEEDNQYVVSLPWKTNHPTLPSNFGLALNRLKSLSRKFQIDKDFMSHYSNVIREQETRGFIEQVTDKYNNNSHYLAHHGVKRDSRTTPVRIVFDCSAKRNAESPSLNDCLWTGPTLTSDLLQMLLKFRMNKFVCTSDIEKAFLMVQLKEEDRNFTRFLWLRNPEDPESELIIYRFKVVLFGARSSPFLLNATIRKHLSLLDSNNYNFKECLYVDNLLYTAETEDNLVQFYYSSCSVFAKAHLYLKEWVSNSKELQTLVSCHGVGGEIKDMNKVLGLGWQIKEDRLRLYGNLTPLEAVTKREILRCISQVFDPLGLTQPVTIRSRILLQELWRSKVSWDDELPIQLVNEWKDLFKDLCKCYDICIPRQILFCPNNCNLHLFSDASNKAYGCVAYLVSEGLSYLVAAKARVAPLKNISVPKLELTAALLSARLANFILKTFRSMKFGQTYVWIDSKVTISWLVSNKPLQVYVRNRVDEIRSLIPDANFSYVKTKENPSDMLSRGVSASFLKNSSLWWEGPSWLKDRESWPVEVNLEDSDLVRTNTCVIEDTHVLHVEEDVVDLMRWDKFSSFRKVVRTMAWVLRYIQNLKRPTSQRKLGGLVLEEEQGAIPHVIKLIQRAEYTKEYISLERGGKGKLHLVDQLNLYLDEGIIRCKGRLAMAELPAETKFPILMPKKHPMTVILIREAHRAVAHMGMNATVAEIRRNYWIPQIRQCVRKVLNTCVTCKRVQGKSFRTPMVPPLPEFRVQCKEPFSVTGIDYTGAMSVRSGPNRTDKAYIILFTCPVSRAIHMELVDNLSCNTFLLAFRKFCNRRIFPSLILSDNATTFVAAAGFLKELAESQVVQEHLMEIKCSWQFIPARAPWFGAIWERLIGLVKTCLKKVLRQALVTFEELSCILTELEAIVNNRPLCYDPGDLNQLEILTPNHLLYGRKQRAFPREVVSWEDFSSDPTLGTTEVVTKRYRYISHLCDHVWHRWRREYLSALRETHNNNARSTVWPKLEEIVLIQDEGPRARWKLGRIIGLFPGGDGLTRVVQLKTSTGTMTRPIVKLYPLELSSVVEPESVPEDAASEKRPSRRAALTAAQARKELIETGQL